VSVPYLSIACACGRWASVECPTIVDIPTAQEAFVGWEYDDHGFARCPECLAAAETVIRMLDRKDVRQGELFAGEAA